MDEGDTAEGTGRADRTTTDRGQTDAGGPPAGQPTGPPAQPGRRHPSAERPLAVSGTAVIYGLSALLGILGGLFIAAAGAVFTQVLPSFMGPFVGALGAIMGIFMVLIGVVALVVGWALWTGRDWGRAIAVVFSGIGLVFALIGLVGAASGGDPAGILSPLLLGTFHGGVVYFLTRPYVQRWFRAMPA